MDSYIVVLVGFGALVLLTAWLPLVLSRMPLSLPMVCVAIGAGLFSLPGLPGTPPHPDGNLPALRRLTEVVLVISLMGAGLKLDRLIGWRAWAPTWRLLALAMPLTIGALAWLGSALLGLGVATALLLGASLAPTDPVLASDVQVGPPLEGAEDEMRFALTSEAGLNDGLAFPFVLLALVLASGEPWTVSSAAAWFGDAVLWRIGCGIGLGVAIGSGLGWLTFHLPIRSKLSRSGAGFVALGITALAYGLTELAHGYGFVAVFVAALALRQTERGHEFHVKLHDFTEELERLLTMVLLVLLGGALVPGGVLAAIGWPSVAFALLALFVVRPLCGWVCLAGLGLPRSERAVIAFFGIRGLGTVYYLAFALGQAPFEAAPVLWGTAGLTVLISIVLHGVTVTPVLAYLDRTSGRDGETAQLELTLDGAAQPAE